jgi:hypothetical protein
VEKELGEPEGNATMDKLKWIASKIGLSTSGQTEIEAETQAEAEEASKAQSAIEQRQGAWKAMPGNVSWRYGGSGLDDKYASGL